MRRGLSFAVIFLSGSCLLSGPSLGDFCQNYVMAVSQRLAYCNGGFPEDWAKYIDGDGLCAGVESSNNTGRIAYHAELADSCIRIVNELPCDNLAIRSAAELDIYCVATVTGQGGDQGTCDADRDCQLDFHCDYSAAKCPGVCLPLLDQNGKCSPELGNVCKPGLACIRVGDAAGTRACMLPFDAGMPCMESGDCAGQAFCDSSMSPAVCVTKPMVGPCPDGVDDDCAQKSKCLSNGGCAPATDAGAPCTVGNNECELLSSCVHGVCQTWGNAGEPCGTLEPGGEVVNCLQGGCRYDPFGMMGTCVVLMPGDPCDTSDECGPGGLCQGEDGGAAICHPRCSVR